MRVVFRQLSGAVALSVAALTWAALDASPAGARDNDDAEDVRPVLECVSLNGDGAYTAVFGTDNRGRSTENLPVGSGNNVSPSPANRGQPTRIAAGRSVGSFTVGFPASGTVTWNLAGRSATATRQSRACSTAPVVSEAAVSAVLVLVAGAIGLLWWLRRPELDGRADDLRPTG
ncbi:MAG: hypothetical protein IT196_17795 [Acidimicrobiales bacterium]|nr:hypothetical protein [Acidimicrobiales bacterium]